MKKSILIVDDNPINLTLTKDILKSLGHSTLETMDAETAIKIARESRPDLIIMDIRLPGMSGIEAAALLKNDRETGNIPIVILSASVYREDREKALDSGCDGFLEKPFRLDDFTATMKAFLDK